MRRASVLCLAYTYQEVGVRLEVSVKDGHVVIVHQQLHALQMPLTEYDMTSDSTQAFAAASLCYTCECSCMPPGLSSACCLPRLCSLAVLLFCSIAFLGLKLLHTQHWRRVTGLSSPQHIVVHLSFWSWEGNDKQVDGAYILEGAGLVALAVGAAHALAADAPLLPLQALVVHQVLGLLVCAVVQHL